MQYNKKSHYTHAPIRPKPLTIKPEASIQLALSGDVEEYSRFVEAHPDLVNAKDEKGNVAMHVACSKGNRELAELLIRSGANINLQDMHGNSPLHYSIDKGKNDLVEMLVRQGASVNLADFRGNTPLHSACATNNLIVVEVLLRSGADPEAMDFANKKPADRTTSHPVRLALERAIAARKDDGESMATKTINWMGFGIGLGVGLGIALAKQQEFYAKQLREEQKREKEEEEKRREEMQARLNQKAVKKEKARVRQLL